MKERKDGRVGSGQIKRFEASAAAALIVILRMTSVTNTTYVHCQHDTSSSSIRGIDICYYILELLPVWGEGIKEPEADFLNISHGL